MTDGSSLHDGRVPIRQHTPNPIVRPSTSIERTCARCGSSFIGLAPGETGERGIWGQWHWFCSVECAT